MLLFFKFAFLWLFWVTFLSQTGFCGREACGGWDTVCLPQTPASWFFSSKGGIVAGGCPAEGFLLSAEIGSDVSQTHPVASDDGYDFFAVDKGHKDSLGWLVVQSNMSLCRESSFSSWFHRGSGSTCLPSFVPYNSPMWSVLLFPPFNRWETKDQIYSGHIQSERIPDLPRAHRPKQ